MEYYKEEISIVGIKKLGQCEQGCPDEDFHSIYIHIERVKRLHTALERIIRFTPADAHPFPTRSEWVPKNSGKSYPSTLKREGIQKPLQTEAKEF